MQTARPEFFALLLMYVKFEAVSFIKRISTNGRSIYFNSAFIEKLKDDELDYILCHQIMHIINEDVWRDESLAYSNYHYACDIKLNNELFDMGFSMERTSHLPKRDVKLAGSGIDTKLSTTIEIADSVIFNLELMDEKTRSSFIVDSDEYWGKKEDTGTLILDTTEGMFIDIFNKSKDVVSDEWDNDSEKGKWRARAVASAKTASNLFYKQAGSVPDYVKRIIDGKSKPCLDWRKLLQEFVQESITDYSFTPPDKRFEETDFFLPDFNEKSFTPKDILFMVDTSGSVTDRMLAIVYSEIAGALEQFKDKLIGKIGFFDTDVKSVSTMNSISDLENIKPVGNGGTNFHCIFDYMKNNYRYEKPSCIIIFTDGYADWPDESETDKTPILWIIDNNETTPPFGKVARVIDVDNKHV